MLYVRADGNSKIGMGHIMRCLSIAKEIVSRGYEVRFLLASDEPADVLKEADMKYIVLGTDYTDMASEKNALFKILEKGDKILVDSYFVTNDYFMYLRQFGKVFYIDDMHSFEYCVDVIINGNIYGDREKYPVKTVLGGCQYSPLRYEYREARKNRNPDTLLITTGSSDPYKLTEKLVHYIMNDEELKQHKTTVICGKFNDSYAKLKQIEQQNANIKVFKNVSNMWEHMQTAMLAITAGGTTMTELSCMGVPIICFSFVDNQDRIVKTFVEDGYAYYGGFYKEEGDLLIEKLCEAAKILIKDDGLRTYYTQKLMNLVDGKGCSRIADIIIRTE